MDKAQVGIASVLVRGQPLQHAPARPGREGEGGRRGRRLVGMRFNTIGVSDGISMGTEGMSYSLQSRDLIADSIETVMGGQWYDANIVAMPGCDKNMPGCVMAMGRVDRPSLMIYGGTIKPGRGAQGDVLDIVSAFQSYGEFIAGEHRRGDAPGHRAARLPGRRRLRRHVHGEHHGLGHRGAGHVAALQLARRPPRTPGKLDECFAPGAAIRNAARAGPRAQRHHDPRGLRERHGDRHRARRLDQRGAAPDRHGALRRTVELASTTSRR